MAYDDRRIISHRLLTRELQLATGVQGTVCDGEDRALRAEWSGTAPNSLHDTRIHSFQNVVWTNSVILKQACSAASTDVICKVWERFTASETLMHLTNVNNSTLMRFGHERSCKSESIVPSWSNALDLRLRMIGRGRLGEAKAEKLEYGET
jgi:hypothetical protein